MYFVPTRIMTCYITTRKEPMEIDFYILDFIRVHLNILTLICEPGSNSDRLGTVHSFYGTKFFFKNFIKTNFCLGEHTYNEETDGNRTFSEGEADTSRATDPDSALSPKKEKKKKGLRTPSFLKKKKKDKKEKTPA